MEGRIVEIDGKAKIEIWNDSIMNRIDRGGYCGICRKSFRTIEQLIDHFMTMHG